MTLDTVFDFLKELAENNNKEWFEGHKKTYEKAKGEQESFVAEVLKAMAEREEGFAGQKAKDCMFRIFRDVRFSKDKTPYKTNFGSVFSIGGKKHTGAGYYVHMEPGKCFIGGGIWMPQGDILKKIRQEIDYNPEEFESILKERKFQKLFGGINGERLKKAPQGYDETNPAIAYLKLKSFTAGTPVKDEEAVSQSFVKKTLDVFDAMKPFIDFLNRAAE